MTKLEIAARPSLKADAAMRLALEALVMARLQSKRADSNNYIEEAEHQIKALLAELESKNEQSTS